MMVTVGSDHHPFDRLVGWVDRWMDEHHEWSTWWCSTERRAPHVTAGA